MKLSEDTEGITGIADASIVSKKYHDHEKGRKLMASNVNAANEGILEADRNRSMGCMILNRG